MTCLLRLRLKLLLRGDLRRENTNVLRTKTEIDHCVELHIIYSFSYTGLPQHSPLAISRTQNGSKRLACFSKENKDFNQKTEVTGSGPST